MARIQAPIVDSSAETPFAREQVVRLPAGMYGGMFAWYSLPKEYPKYQSEGMEMRFFCGFVLTHDRANNRLPFFGEAIMGVKPKRFYDSHTGMVSSYVSLLNALLAGRVPMEKIATMPEAETPDLDDLIGRPVLLTIEPHAKPDKNGIFGAKVKKIDPMDAALWRAIKPLYDDREMTANGRDCTLRLASPHPDLEKHANSAPQSAGSYTEEADEVPF